MTQKASFIIRDYRPSDEDQFAEVYAAVYGAHGLKDWQDRRQWQFQENPATRDLPSRLWVATIADAVVGFLGAFPVRYKFGDREQTIRHPCDLLAAEAARGMGLGRALIAHYVADCDTLSTALVYAPYTVRIYEALGFTPLNVHPQYLRPYSVTGMLGLKPSTGSPSKGLSHSMRSVAAGGATVLARGVNALRRPKADPRVHVSGLSSATEDFDTLWRQLAPRFTHVGVRDRAFVQWRFFQDPLSKHHVFLARDGSGDPLGYAAVRNIQRRGATVTQLMDLFCDPGDHRTARSLLSAACGHAERHASAAITCMGLHPSLRRITRRYLYAPRPGGQLPAMLLWHGDPAAAAAVYDADQWHLSNADGDEAFTP